MSAPPTAPVFVQTPNHSHAVDKSRINAGAIWWEVSPLLIMNQSKWTAADDNSGIASSKAMDEAEAAGILSAFAQLSPLEEKHPKELLPRDGDDLRNKHIQRMLVEAARLAPRFSDLAHHSLIYRYQLEPSTSALAGGSLTSSGAVRMLQA
ncbi:MAG TPA: hypothetical protein VGI45_05445 [Terracidiphilus sp.]